MTGPSGAAGPPSDEARPDHTHEEGAVAALEEIRLLIGRALGASPEGRGSATE
jgi:hypothetical protein